MRYLPPVIRPSAGNPTGQPGSSKDSKSTGRSRKGEPAIFLLKIFNNKKPQISLRNIFKLLFVDDAKFDVVVPGEAIEVVPNISRMIPNHFRNVRSELRWTDASRSDYGNSSTEIASLSKENASISAIMFKRRVVQNLRLSRHNLPPLL